uniref:Cell death-inducing p53-target protein 1 n=1 Tax=Strix occidentalis caurina TaxID=311401 RepID=A0A8D0F0Y3_STROC
MCLPVPQGVGGAQQGLTVLCLSPCSRCDLCCCLIPCLFDDFKDVTHTCPNCKAYIYTYKRMC